MSRDNIGVYTDNLGDLISTSGIYIYIYLFIHAVSLFNFSKYLLL